MESGYIIVLVICRNVIKTPHICYKLSSMKKIVLLFLIGYTALHAQIAIKYAIPHTNGTLQKMEYSRWEYTNINEDGSPDLSDPVKEKVVIIYENGKPHWVHRLKPNKRDMVPYMKIEFLYDGDEMMSVKEYNNVGFPVKNDFQLNKISIPTYKEGVMISESIFDKDNKLIGLIKYETQQKSPLILGDIYEIGNMDTIKTGRFGIEFDGLICQMQFELKGADTLVSMKKLRDTEDGNVTYLMFPGMNGKPYRVISQINLKKDNQKNILSMVSYNIPVIERKNATVITYRYQYKGDPEWPQVSEVPIFADAFIGKKIWANSSENVLLTFVSTHNNRGFWVCKPYNTDFKGTKVGNTVDWIDKMKTCIKGEWIYDKSRGRLKIANHLGNYIVVLSPSVKGESLELVPKVAGKGIFFRSENTALFPVSEITPIDIFPEIMLAPRIWNVNNEDFRISFVSGKESNEGVWACVPVKSAPQQSQNQGTIFEWTDEVKKEKYGTWIYLPATQQIELLKNGKRVVLLYVDLDEEGLVKLQPEGFNGYCYLSPYNTQAVKYESPVVLNRMGGTVVEVPSPTNGHIDNLFTPMEQVPFFPGGEPAMLKFIEEHLQYPQVAKETGIEGKVFLQFIIEKDGSLSNIEIFRDIGGGCGDAAADVIRAMPKWVPGQQEDVPVRAKYTLPIRFKLSK